MAVAEADTGTPSRARTWWRRQLRAPLAASVGGVVLFWLSLTPSLLPLGPVFQGVVSALCALMGYGAGALAGWMLRSSGVTLGGARRTRTWQVVAVVAATGTLLMLWLGHRWDDQIRDLVGVERDGVGADLLMLAIAATLFTILLAVSRVIRAAASLGRPPGRPSAPRAGGARGRRTGRRLGHLGPGHGRRWRSGRRRLDATFKATTTSSAPSCPRRPARTSRRPTSQASPGTTSAARDASSSLPPPPRRTSPPSPETTPSAGTRLRRVPPTARPPGAAQRAVDELDRMGGFDRSVLNVVTGTGRGWVNENQARALEYMWAGDTATVSMQYSYLPSWMSFLVDGERAQDAGRLLFDAVYAEWVELPRDSRPLLVVSGESLGSFGGEAAFSGSQDIATRTDGALFVGPTNNNRLWSRFTAERAAGTPEVVPVYDGGANVRFADVPTDWTAPGEWDGPRIGYLQHANDPITWWDWSLALNRPDWLEEPPGRDVSPHITWIPMVTMLQLAADQLVANDVPAGQGHQFGQEPARAWAEILPPPGWTTEDTERLVVVVRAPRAIE